VRLVACLATMIVLCLVPAHAQPIVAVEPEPAADERDVPWGLPDDLLVRLAEQAGTYEATAMDLPFRGTTQRIKYPRGRTSVGEARPSSYVFAFDDGAMVAVPTQGTGSSARRYGKSKTPPAHAWMQLFSERNQPFISYRDLGEVPHAFGNARKIQFRGSLPYDDGTDVRQWEGTALIDPSTLRLLEIDAYPLHLWPRLERQRSDYLQSFRLVFIRFKKRPIAERVHLRFDVQPSGISLPVQADVERFELTAPGRAVVRSRLVTRFDYETPAQD